MMKAGGRWLGCVHMMSLGASLHSQDVVTNTRSAQPLFLMTLLSMRGTVRAEAVSGGRITSNTKMLSRMSFLDDGSSPVSCYWESFLP